MTLVDILNRRRSVRHYDGEKWHNSDTVRHYLELAQLASSSSNLQLYEFYHVTDTVVLQRLGSACLGQKAATTAQQMVVFVIRQDLHRSRVQTALAFEHGNIHRNSPLEKQVRRVRWWELYYTGSLPILYARSLAFWASCARY